MLATRLEHGICVRSWKSLIFLLCFTLTPLSHAAVTVDDVDKL